MFTEAIDRNHLCEIHSLVTINSEGNIKMFQKFNGLEIAETFYKT